MSESLAAADPGNANYQRDLSICYERFADLAIEAGDDETAREWLGRAARIRSALHQLDPTRVDFAEELASAFLRQVIIGDDLDSTRAAAMRVLQPFAQRSQLTSLGTAVLARLRAHGGEAAEES